MSAQPGGGTGLVAHTEAALVRVPPPAFWPWFVKTPLEEVLPGGGGLPRVAGTEPLPGPAWGEVGASRIVRLDDGTSVSEAIAEADAPSRFAYRVWGFEGLPGLLLAEAFGRFDFARDAATGGTRIAWTYAFAPRAALLRPLVRIFVRRRFAAFMRTGLAEMTAQAEAAHAAAA